MAIAGTLIESEAATLNFVRRNSSIPVPEVFASCPTRSNEIGVPFILMSKAPGSPLSDWTWKASRSPLSQDRCPCLPWTAKQKVMFQLGQIASQLSKLPFDKIGSIFEDAASFDVKECLAMPYLLHERDELRSNFSQGPFTEESEYYKSLIEAYLSHAEMLPMEYHAFLAPVPMSDEYDKFEDYRAATDRWNDFVAVGSMIDSAKNRLEYIVVGELLQEMIPSLALTLPSSEDTKSPGFFLSHPDLSPSNIFVDDDFNITNIIDWAFASTVPFSTLLIPPGMPHPRNDTDPLLRPAFYEGFEEGGGKQLAPRDILSERCRRAWLFNRLISLDSLQEYPLFAELYRMVHGDEDFRHLFRKIKAQKKFVEKAESLAEYEMPKSDILQEEIDYFSHVGFDRLAISRKLVLASEMNQEFVADKRLWMWLREALG
ncbi:MAG: hypothetical protein M4579_006861 [Chaenotheca gracillima]|nr:MAG: hypothetical protein M4579_006861 [Chaenotheca gracillima]